ncbi:MAG: porin [Dongiaceae bacterium]
MKKVLLGTTALLGAGLVASPAFAADGIKLGLGGFFKTAYMATFDDDSEGEAGNEHNTDGFFSDAEVHFTGSTVLDNGLEIGARIELEGENANDQIDEAWVYFSGGFGEVRIGSQDDALGKLCLLPPGGTANFSAFSPSEWGANTLTTNSACSGVAGDAQKILYISPSFAGFQLGISYTPTAGAEDQTPADRGGPHTGMHVNVADESRHDVAAYLSYSYEGDGWGLSAGAGGAWEGHVERTKPGPDRNEASNYQAALNFTFGNFAIGGAFEYYHNALDQGPNDIDAWVAGGGISYTIDAWTVGAQYTHGDADDDGASNASDQQDRVALTGNYAMGPGINVDAELAYTWTDTSNGGTGHFADDASGLDNYDAFEIGIGTAITF